MRRSAISQLFCFRPFPSSFAISAPDGPVLCGILVMSAGVASMLHRDVSHKGQLPKPSSGAFENVPAASLAKTMSRVCQSNADGAAAHRTRTRTLVEAERILA
jgi:hypothetical protein